MPVAPSSSDALALPVENAATEQEPAGRDAAGRVSTAVRVIYGAAMLLVPRPALAALTRPVSARRAPDATEVVVARVLGLRQLVQAAVARALPRGRTAGALVDAVHALSMLAWAVLDRGHRSAALSSAVAFAATAASRTADGAGPSGSTHGGPLRCSPRVVH